VIERVKALFASTKSTASVSGAWKMLRMAYTAASQPSSWPAHSWSGPAASSTSPPMIFKMALAMILLRTSPTPIGLTPGHLSSGIRRQATNALSPSRLTLVVAMRPTPASAIHKLFEADLKSIVFSMHMRQDQRGQLHHGYAGLCVLWHLRPGRRI